MMVSSYGKLLKEPEQAQHAFEEQLKSLQKDRHQSNLELEFDMSHEAQERLDKKIAKNDEVTPQEVKRLLPASHAGLVRQLHACRAQRFKSNGRCASTASCLFRRGPRQLREIDTSIVSGVAPPGIAD